MTWLSRYYDRRVASGRESDFLHQVGHTEKGVAISDAQFQIMLGQLRATLDLQPGDALLDLCCGNGVFTRPLAQSVRRAVGVDFSAELISAARANFKAENLTYHLQDVKRLDELNLSADGKFNKVLMNGALQHFTASEFRALLQTIVKHTTEDRIMLFGFVPDFDKQAAFRVALNPGIGLRLRQLLRRDLVGSWWRKADLTALCADLGLNVEFSDVDPAFDAARYRFDIRIW